MTLEQLVQQWRDEADKLRAEAVGFDVDTRTELELDADIHEEHASQLEAWIRANPAEQDTPILHASDCALTLGYDLGSATNNCTCGASKEEAP